MHRNQKLNIVLAAGVAVALLFAAAVGNLGVGQVWQRANAVEEGNSTMPSTNESGSTGTAQNAGSNSTNGTDGAEVGSNMTMPPGPPIGDERRVILTGTLSAQNSPDDPNFYTVDILPPRQDGLIYNGLVTFTASKKVLVGVYQNYGVANSSEINPSFGEPFNFPVDEQGHKIAISVMEPQYANSFPAPSATLNFVGTGLTVATLDEQPFTITYSVYAYTWKPMLYDNVDSAKVKSNSTSMPGNNATTVTITEGAFSQTDKAYSPNPMNVKVGDTITWINNDFMQHTVTSGNGTTDENSGKEFGSPLISPGGTFDHKFDKAGEYDYYCQIHPNMVGKISVQ